MCNLLPLSRTSSLFKKIPINKLGIDYIVGDIHGCFDELDEVLEIIGFTEGDRLFCVGDLIDRGATSERCFEYLDKPWFYSVLGNHEYFSMMYLNDELDEAIYNTYGGKWLTSQKERYAEKVLDYFTNLPLAIELDTPSGKIGIVHSDVQDDDWEEFKTYINKIVSQTQLNNATLSVTLRRDRFKGPSNKEIKNLDYLVHGHIYIQSPRMVGNTIYLETGIVFNGAFSILNTTTLGVTTITKAQLDKR